MPMSDAHFDAEPPRSWVMRHKWLALLLVIGMLATIVIVFCCGGIFSAYRTVRESEPYRQAVERVTSNPVVIEQLGEPLTASALPLGELRYIKEQSAARARIEFSVTGPRGVAQVKTESQLYGDAWILRKLSVKLPDGRDLELVK